ncbi:MAG: hypothetical protein LBD59_07180 [Prevotellaceae bacterium]|nr:hypothetical protein [Prevotellaceae bacterium]
MVLKLDFWTVRGEGFLRLPENCCSDEAVPEWIVQTKYNLVRTAGVA